MDLVRKFHKPAESIMELDREIEYKYRRNGRGYAFREYKVPDREAITDRIYVQMIRADVGCEPF